MQVCNFIIHWSNDVTVQPSELTPYGPPATTRDCVAYDLNALCTF